MTQYLVTVHQPKFRDGVMSTFSEYGEVEPSAALPRAFRITLTADEADFALSAHTDPRVSGAVDLETPVKGASYGEKYIREGRVFTDKPGALRLKATLDTGSGVLNPWWQLPGFFKWRYDTDRLGAGTIIAIIDGGVSTGHPEFRDTPGRVTRVYNYFNSDHGASDHGIACSTLAAGATIGIAPEAEVWDAKVFATDANTGASAAIIAAMEAVTAAVSDETLNPDGKFVVCNISLSATGENLANPYGSVLSDMQDAGVIPIVAAGNDGKDLDSTHNVWPAESTDYAVGAIHYDGRRAAFSNYGSRVRFYGVGHRIIKGERGNGYSNGSGTSYAAPYLCGCLATWLPGRWVPENSEQVRTLMDDYYAFCSEGIYGDSVSDMLGNSKIDGAVLGRASYFPVLPGNVIAPQINVVTKFGSAERGTMGWKMRATPILGGAGRAVTGQGSAVAAFFEGPFGFPGGGPWLDGAYTPTGWTITNDRVKNSSVTSGDGMFVVTSHVLSQKEYWEAEVRSAGDEASVGVTKATNRANYNEATTGIGAAGVEWFSDGSLLADGVALTDTITFTTGDRLMLAYDADTGDFWCGKNGVWAADPASEAALASTATGDSHAAMSAGAGVHFQLYGEQAHVQNNGGDYTPFDIGEAVAWAMDATAARAGHTLSNDDRTLENTTGGGNYLWWVPTENTLTTATTDLVYWEFHCLSTGDVTYAGYHALVTLAEIAAQAGAGTNSNPVTNGSAGRRGNGSLWASTTGSASQSVTGLQTFGRDKVLMMAFKPSSRELWTGVDGTWDDDPASDPATYTLYSGASEWAVALQGRNALDGGTIVSTPGDFSYTAPVGAVPLSTIT